MEYEDVNKEEKLDEKEEQSVVYEPNVTYVVKNNHKVLKNTLFYVAVAIMLVLNFVFILDMTSTEFTSSIAQGVRSVFYGSEQVTQNTAENSSFVNFVLSGILYVGVNAECDSIFESSNIVLSSLNFTGYPDALTFSSIFFILSFSLVAKYSEFVRG